jgi:nitrilase
MRIAGVQARPVWLDPAQTTAKVISLLEDAAHAGAELVAFPETYLCGYPFWVCRTNGAAFNDPRQKEAYARYLEAAVETGGPEVTTIRQAAGDLGLFVFLGVTERGARCARGSTYCSLVAIDPDKGVVGVHRKLAPTHDERLVWARGDGHGLRTHEFRGVRIGGLSCWENWMPQARHALYCDGADIHIATWPGWSALTADITRFIAQEGRVFSMSVSGLLSLDDIPSDFPMLDEIRAEYPVLPFDGGSGIAGPDGTWVVPPLLDEDKIVIADLDPVEVRRERMMFDPSGHYSRPDVFETIVHRRRQEAAVFDDPGSGVAIEVAQLTEA